MQIDRALSDFEGAWQIDRQIVHDDGHTATFVGEAVFTRAGPATLIYDETGQLRLPTGQTMHATRSYRWDDGLRVFFDDGRPFHQIPAGGGRASHFCAPDTYDVAYDFSTWPRWQAVWDVAGPKKAYRMTTVYRRG